MGLTADEARQEAIRRLKRGEANVEIESHGRVVELDDPAATGYAIECWIYVMEGDA